MKRQKQYVAYYRVSTKGQSLGLDAQKTMVKEYLKDKWPPVASFEEKESGKSDHNRPALKEALDYCKKHNAILVVATLSRLTRDLYFLTLLQKQKQGFVICDMPEANSFSLNIMGAVAQYERETISKRTSRALQEVKRKGKKLGSQNPKVLKGLKQYWEKCAVARVEKQHCKVIKRLKDKDTELPAVVRDDNKVLPIIKTFRKQKMSYAKIATALNSSGVASRRGHKWHTQSVYRVAKRAGL